MHKGTDMLIKMIEIKENANGQILLRQFIGKLRNLSSSNHTSARNVMRTTQKVTAIPTTVLEAAGLIAQRNYMCARNGN